MGFNDYRSIRAAIPMLTCGTPNVCGRNACILSSDQESPRTLPWSQGPLVIRISRSRTLSYCRRNRQDGECELTDGPRSRLRCCVVRRTQVIACSGSPLATALPTTASIPDVSDRAHDFSPGAPILLPSCRTSLASVSQKTSDPGASPGHPSTSPWNGAAALLRLGNV